MILYGLAVGFMIYVIYGLGVLHGQRHERRMQNRKEQIREIEIDGICEKLKGSTKPYTMVSPFGYEIFHVNNN